MFVASLATLPEIVGKTENIGTGMPTSWPNLYRSGSKSQQTNVTTEAGVLGIQKVFTMKKLSILIPAIAAGILVSGLVVAAPQTGAAKVTVAKAPDRAAAYLIATAN